MRILLFFCFVSISFRSFAQSDSINYQALFNAMQNCESLSIKAQDILVAFELNEIPKSKLVLDIWEKTCDKTEPSQRLNILIDIANNNFDEYKYWNYYESMIKNYSDRIKDSYEKDFSAIYDSSKSYYYYVPLKGKFDMLTKKLALMLKDKQEPNSSAFLLCTLFSGEIGRFNDLVVRDEYSNTAIFKNFFPKVSPSLDDFFHLDVGAGTWFPFGKLSHTFSLNPVIAAGLRFSYNNWSYAFEFHFRIPNNKNPFELAAGDSIYKAKQDFSFNTGLYVSKYWTLNKNLNFEIIGGLGVDNIQSDIKKPEQNEEGEDTFYHITTINMNTGIGFWYKLKNNRSLGLQLRYLYSPYELDRNLKYKIGSSALLLSAYYSFSFSTIN